MEGPRGVREPEEALGTARERSRVLFILPKTSLECLLGNKGGGLPPRAGGLAPAGLVEGLLELLGSGRLGERMMGVPEEPS